jgi:hypothetical protein
MTLNLTTKLRFSISNLRSHITSKKTPHAYRMPKSATSNEKTDLGQVNKLYLEAHLKKRLLHKKKLHPKHNTFRQEVKKDLDKSSKTVSTNTTHHQKDTNTSTTDTNHSPQEKHTFDLTIRLLLQEDQPHWR